TQQLVGVHGVADRGLRHGRECRAEGLPEPCTAIARPLSAAAGRGTLRCRGFAMLMRIHLTGTPKIEAGTATVDGGPLRTRQGRLVFAYLVCNRGRRVTR